MLDHWWPPDVSFPLECHLNKTQVCKPKIFMVITLQLFALNSTWWVLYWKWGHFTEVLVSYNFSENISLLYSPLSDPHKLNKINSTPLFVYPPLFIGSFPNSITDCLEPQQRTPGLGWHNFQNIRSNCFIQVITFTLSSTKCFKKVNRKPNRSLHFANSDGTCLRGPSLSPIKSLIDRTSPVPSSHYWLDKHTDW